MNKVLPLCILLLSGVVSQMAAQTTQNKYTVLSAQGKVIATNTYVSAFSVRLSGEGNQVSWINGEASGYGKSSCGGSTGSNGTGFIELTMNGNPTSCLNSTSFSTSGTVANEGCSGPANATMYFEEGDSQTGVIVLYFGFNRLYNHCYTNIVGGTLTY